MPTVRATRQRAVTNENDENAGPTRMTRAKAAGLSATEHAGDVPKKTLATKKSTATLNGAARTRTTRAALGDVSNTIKVEGLAAGVKDGKKPAAAKGAVAKAARPTGVQKASQAEKARPALASKPPNKRIAPADANKPAGKKLKPPPVVVEQDTEEEEENVVPKEEEKPTKSKKEVAAAKVEVVEEELKTKREEIVEVFEEEVVDLDKEDVDDPLMLSEYVVEIFEYLKELEIATMANPDMASVSVKEKSTGKRQSSKSPAKASAKEQGKGKTSKKAKAEPTREEMHAVVVDILKEVDFNTATLSDILRQLGTHFELDLMHRKAEVKDIITDVINNMTDEEDEGEEDDDNAEDGGDADKDDGDGDA